MRTPECQHTLAAALKRLKGCAYLLRVVRIFVDHTHAVAARSHKLQSAFDASEAGKGTDAVVKAGDKYKDVSISVKASRELMESLGYRWVNPSSRVSMGYWRRPPGAGMRSPETVNRIVRESVTKSLDAINCAE